VLPRLRREAQIELRPRKILQRPAIIGIEFVRSAQVAEGLRRPTAPDGSVANQVIASMVRPLSDLRGYGRFWPV
jgi:hypothetical protein